MGELIIPPVEVRPDGPGGMRNQPMSARIFARTSASSSGEAALCQGSGAPAASDAGDAGYFAGVLVEDAGAVRPLACSEEDAESAAVPAQRKL